MGSYLNNSQLNWREKNNVLSKVKDDFSFRGHKIPDSIMTYFEELYLYPLGIKTTGNLENDMVVYIQKKEGGLSDDPSDTDPSKTPVGYTVAGGVGYKYTSPSVESKVYIGKKTSDKWHTNKGFIWPSFKKGISGGNNIESYNRFFNMSNEDWIKVYKEQFYKKYAAGITKSDLVNYYLSLWYWGSGAGGADPLLNKFKQSLRNKGYNSLDDFLEKNSEKKLLTELVAYRIEAFKVMQNAPTYLVGWAGGALNWYRYFIPIYTKDDEEDNSNPTSDNQVNSDQTDGNTGNEDENIGQESSRDVEGSNNNTTSESRINGITNIFPPSIKISPIILNVGGDDNYKKEFISGLGFIPLVWYNGIQFEAIDIQYFSLYSDGLIPMIKMTFFDRSGLLEADGMPVDDTKIKLFLHSRSDHIKPIYMQFKISKFSIVSEKTYTLDGVCDVNGLYLKEYKSYSARTSYEILQDLCRRVGIGFNTNVDNSNDRMKWLNPGKVNNEFMDYVISNSYISDDSVISCYIDYYYNFNYVDIEKEMKRNIDEDVQLNTSGLNVSTIKKDESIKPMLLSNDESIKESNSYFGEFVIINNSTSISLEKGYSNRVKYYDVVSKEFLIFDIDSNTSNNDKSIILKGAPSDETFFNENKRSTYMGKLDNDNMHSNYNYTYVQNKQNIDDLTKIAVSIVVPTPNYNLYRYQKVRMLFTNSTPTPANSMLVKRLNGEWMIIDIRFIFESENKIYQKVTLIKRELSLSDEEADNQPDINKKSNDVREVNDNPSDFTQNENTTPDNTEQQGSTSSTPISNNYFFGWPISTSNLKISTAYVRPGSNDINGGIDLISQVDKNVYASADGIVINAPTFPGVCEIGDKECGSGYGNYIIIRHIDNNGKNWVTLYGHMEKNSLKFKVGDNVKKGQPIGTIGNTGFSSNEHLHFELLFDTTLYVSLKSRQQPYSPQTEKYSVDPVFYLPPLPNIDNTSTEIINTSILSNIYPRSVKNRHGFDNYDEYISSGST